MSVFNASVRMQHMVSVSVICCNLLHEPQLVILFFASDITYDTLSSQTLTLCFVVIATSFWTLSSTSAVELFDPNEETANALVYGLGWAWNPSV